MFNFYSGFFINKASAEKQKRILLGSAVTINILFLSFFKYFNFFRESAETLIKSFDISGDFLLLNVILPVGLSFYILRAISYNIDIFRKKIVPESSFIDFAIFIAFFPQLLSGPIARPEDFLTQLRNGGAKKIENIHAHIFLILSGLFKKLVIASSLTTNIVNDVFAVPQNHSQLSVLLAIYAYAIVIYCDFSGYSDMAIGIAGLMGFSSPRNFDNPYSSIDFGDFWKRWHITFSQWLRDYVYIPLGGSRKGKLRKYANIMATMLISGLWHGVGMQFAVWGAFHGLGVIYSHLKEGLTRTVNNLGTVRNWLSWFVTFNSICVLWIFFGVDNMSGFYAIMKQLFNWNTESEPIALYTIILVMVSFAFFVTEDRIKNLFIKSEQKLPLLFQALSVSLIVLMLVKLGPDIIPPFIYFKF